VSDQLPTVSYQPSDFSHGWTGVKKRPAEVRFPGFLINQQRQSEVRIRSIRIKFLNPTEEQLQEYDRDATYNWLRHKEKEKQKLQHGT